jgi:hypothetical protein
MIAKFSEHLLRAAKKIMIITNLDSMKRPGSINAAANMSARAGRCREMISGMWLKEITIGHILSISRAIERVW